MKKQEEFTEEEDEEGGGIYEDRRARAPYAAKDVPSGQPLPKNQSAPHSRGTDSDSPVPP